MKSVFPPNSLTGGSKSEFVVQKQIPYISLIDEASDFGIRLGFAKAYHIITLREKSGAGLGLGDLLKILMLPYSISATAGARDFKFGTQLGFAKAHHKITFRGKVAMPLGWGSSPIFWGSPIIFLQRLGLGTSNLARI